MPKEKMVEENRLYAGLEGGGTKFVCLLGSDPQNILAEARFPTTTPKETFRQVVTFFKDNAHVTRLSAVGVASFGPLDLDPESPTYGYITATTKPGWDNTDMLKDLREELGIPITIEHDVAAAAFGEYYWNPENHTREPLIYFTIGTGIGAGVIIDGRPLHGLVHPETGHMRIPHDRTADPYPGCCPFHGDCFEGLASGPAMHQRWGRPAELLPDDHPAWAMEATYISLAMANIICSLSPKRIILGGGVMHHKPLFPLIHQKVLALLNDYVQSPTILVGMDEYIVAPVLGDRSGTLGAIALARVHVENN